MKPKELSVFDKHQLKIAYSTLKMSDVGARIMGGMTKEEARKIIKKLTGKESKEEGMTKAQALMSIMEDADSLDAGFAIVTPHEDVINDNFRDRRGRKPTDDEWKQINNDISIIERNTVAYLKKVLTGARDEGHDKYGDLIGSCWCKWDNKKGLELIKSNMEGEGNQELNSEEETAIFKGISKIGEDALDCSFYFFNISDEDKAKLEEIK